MTKRLDTPKFIEPDGINIEIGDFLVGHDEDGRIRIAPITNIGHGRYVTAQIGNLTNELEYERAVILKRDGTYLVGKKAYEQLAQSKNPV